MKTAALAGSSKMTVTSNASPLSILIAEDDVAVAKGFESILLEAGYRVVGIARNGLEAVDLANAFHPDIILMDIKMPQMDGIEAARNINRARGGFIPIVLVTAYADAALVERAKESGVLGYLVKPVHLDDLVPAVEMAYSTAQRITALEGAVSNLSEELEARKLVERAKGILMKRLKISEAEAYQMMQQEARRQRIKLKNLAMAIVSSESLLS